MAKNLVSKKLGILGGLGPLASAEFLKTIYEFNTTAIEQESPICVLLSDPTFPDRSEAILGASDRELKQRLMNALETLNQSGASKIVIACVTLHHLLPQIPWHLQRKIISLVDITIEELLNRGRRHLLLCTDGTRRAGLFTRHRLWDSVRHYIILPSDEDQARVHRLIYEIKKNCKIESCIPLVQDLLQKYRLDSFISGCTELHLLTKHLVERGGGTPNYSMIDPLLNLAKNLESFLEESSLDPKR
jgi:aspartate racemase